MQISNWHKPNRTTQCTELTNVTVGYCMLYGGITLGFQRKEDWRMAEITMTPEEAEAHGKNLLKYARRGKELLAEKHNKQVSGRPRAQRSEAMGGVYWE